MKAPAIPAPLRELRWLYVRGTAREHCHLSLDPERSAYEFRLWNVDPRFTVLRCFSHACEAIEWHSAHEATLVGVGFSLEAFELATVG